MQTKNCRSCGSTNLKLVYDFGLQPLAGCYPQFPNSVQPIKKYPLDLTRCEDCTLLQVTSMPPISEIFHNDYKYSSSTIPDLVSHFTEFAKGIISESPATPSILEFGCNDGVLLEQLKCMGCRVVGIDASDNVAEIARRKGLDVHTGFFTSELIEVCKLSAQFDVVTCSNVFAHIHNLKETLDAVKKALKPNGLFFIEVHDGEMLSKELQFDTIYHEHLTYFTEDSLRYLLEINGFTYVYCKKTRMHGGALRMLVKNSVGNKIAPVASHNIINSENLIQKIRKCQIELEKIANSYKSTYGYGAAGRSQMFINMTNTSNLFAGVFDDSPLRCGKYIVGTDIEILKFTPWNYHDVCIILAWNYAETISKNVKHHFGKTVTLLPNTKYW